MSELEAWRGETYYGRSPLKPAPFESWVVGGYVFLAGLGGKASLLSALAGVTGRGSETILRHGRYLPLVAPTLGAALLVYDLHTPSRFYQMMRIAKGTSPMSIGTWILSGFSLASLASAGLHYLGERRDSDGMRQAAAVAHAPAAVLGLGMGTYTAALLAATSTPLWAAAPRALGIRFAAASVASGATALSLLEEEGATRRALDGIAALSLATELVVDGAQKRRYRQTGIADAVSPTRGAAQALGTAVPLGLYLASIAGGGRSPLSRVAGLFSLASTLLMRVSILQQGARSAARPEIAFRFAQPENLPTPARVRARVQARRARRDARRRRPSG